MSDYDRRLREMAGILLEIGKRLRGEAPSAELTRACRARLRDFVGVYQGLSSAERQRVQREQPRLVAYALQLYLLLHRDPTYADPDYGQAEAERDAGRIAAGALATLSAGGFGPLHLSPAVEPAERTALAQALQRIAGHFATVPGMREVLAEVQATLAKDPATSAVPVLVWESDDTALGGTNKVYYSHTVPGQPLIGVIVLTRGVLHDFPPGQEALALVLQNELFETAWTLAFDPAVQLYSKFGAISAAVSHRLYRELIGAPVAAEELLKVYGDYVAYYDAANFVPGDFAHEGALKTLVERLIAYGTAGACGDLASLNATVK